MANVRPGLRRLTFKNDRDDKENPIAIALVDIQIYTLEDIEERQAKQKDLIGVKHSIVKPFHSLIYENHQRAIYDEGRTDLTDAERGLLNKDKGDSMAEVNSNLLQETSPKIAERQDILFLFM